MVYNQPLQGNKLFWGVSPRDISKLSHMAKTSILYLNKL